MKGSTVDSLVYTFFAIFGIVFVWCLAITTGLWTYVIHNHFKSLSKWWWLLWFPCIVVSSFFVTVLLIKFLIKLNS